MLTSDLVIFSTFYYVMVMVMVTVFNGTVNNISVTFVYVNRQFYWWRKLEYPGNTTDLPHPITTATPPPFSLVRLTYMSMQIVFLMNSHDIRHHTQCTCH